MKYSFFSHPGKYYEDHIKRVADGFDDPEHKVVAYYHDMGKLSDAFQRYITLQKREDETYEAFEKRRNKLKTTHTLESAYLYFFNRQEKNFLANFFTIWKHHSYLPDIAKSVNEDLSVIDSVLEESRLASIAKIAKANHLEIGNIYDFIDYFEEMVDERSHYGLKAFLMFKKRYSRLILADKFEAIFDQSYRNVPVFSQESVAGYLARVQNSIEQKQRQNPNDYRTKAREAIFSNFEKKDSSRIYLIKAPTGVGKTLIALELALKITQKTADKRRVITAIPFTSIIDQTHSVYEDVLGKGNVLKYHHLTKRVKDDSDEQEQFSQKVFLSDIWQETFIVTTFNQLLFTIFSNQNRDNLRLETLRDSVVIIDEVQNISRVLLRDIVKTLELFAGEYNIHFIVMSATMPSFDGILEHSTILSEAWFYQQKQNRYRLVYDEAIRDFETLSQAINAQQSSVLCVVNTIQKAKVLYNLIEGEEGKEKFLLTTHQIPLHRKEMIDEIKEALKRGEKVKLISTQLIEAGVDLDFEAGFREFAPFGSIIQTAGRVNREGRHNISDLVVFDFLDTGGSDEVKRLPYNQIDLQEERVREWLRKSLEEIDILHNIDTYFEAVKKETNSVSLFAHMKALKFETLLKVFSENFMLQQSWKVSLVVEIDGFSFDEFIIKREEILQKFDKFEARDRVKELEKELGLYTIAVSEQLLKKDILSQHNIKEMFGRYILPKGSFAYSKYRGFGSEFIELEESLGFN